VTIEGWPRTTTQVGANLERLLPLFGAQVSRDDHSLTVDGGAGVNGGATLAGVELNGDIEVGELAPTIVALAALANEPSTIVGIGHLRGHETDRLAALATEINGLGGSVRELPDGLDITPAPLRGGTWHTYSDHRMATSGALIGLAVAEVAVEDIATTAKTLPQFVELWTSLLGQPQVGQTPDSQTPDSQTQVSP
jgi:3-phosphoshikimate 1-carboxyvinyltransferase